MKQSFFKRDFTLVVIGQIISLFGNQILRYALPLYLLNQTGSAFLFGVTMALSFVPMLILAPVGGIIADRRNKRNIMVVLDFSTAVLILGYSILYSTVDIIALTIMALMLLYGIQGLYQPTVQASVPLLVVQENLMQGNAVINMVNSLAGILGPVIGGVVFGMYGIRPILIVGIICFIFSAVMEIFIHIPYVKRTEQGSVLSIAASDMKESFHFIMGQKPEIGKVGLLITVINAVFSALIVVGLPVVINSQLGFEEHTANTLYGYAQGSLALGGLLGGLLAGMLGKRLDIRKSAGVLLGCSATLLPIALSLFIGLNPYVTYFIIAGSCVLMMILSTILSIMLITYIQMVTPENLMGKIMALLTCLVMCGHPIGQLIYGYLLEVLSEAVYILFTAAFVLAIVITVVSHKLFRKL